MSVLATAIALALLTQAADDEADKPPFQAEPYFQDEQPASLVPS